MTRSIMFRITGALVIVLALLVAGLHLSSKETSGVTVISKLAAAPSATADEVVTQRGITVRDLGLTKAGYPRIKVTTKRKHIKLLFALPGVVYHQDGLIPHARGSKVYPMLKKAKRGETVTWEIHAYDSSRGTEPFFHVFTWTRPVAEVSSSWRSTFSWTKVANPLKECPKGRVYTFALQEHDGVSYLAAESTLKLRLKRANGKVVTRSVELAFGDGDLVWMPRVASTTRVISAVVRVSGKGQLPAQVAEFACMGT